MAFGEDIDTLNMLYDKMQYIFSGYDQYIKSFDDAQTLFKQKNLSEREFFEKAIDVVLKYSALGFLSIKVLFEIKKTLDRMTLTKSKPKVDEVLHISFPPHSIASFIVAKNLPQLNESKISVQIGSKHCSFCNNVINNEAKFCKNCGNML